MELGNTTTVNDIHILRVPSSSRAARLAAFLNSPDLRRDPWNITLPTELVYFDGTDSSGSELEHLASSAKEGSTTKWAFMMQRSWRTDTINATAVNCSPDPSQSYYYRPWNDPPLTTVRDCFDFVQQLLEVRVCSFAFSLRPTSISHRYFVFVRRLDFLFFGLAWRGKWRWDMRLAFSLRLI